MRRSIAAVMTGALCVASAASATPSRVVGLGDMGLYVEDDTNVLRYPGLLGRYTHFVYIDLGGQSGLQPTQSDTQAGGLNGGAFLRLSDGLHLGVIASDFVPGEQTAFMSQVANAEASPNAGVFNSLIPESPLRRYDLLFGYAPDKYFGAGLRFSYGSDTDTFIPDQNTKTDKGNDRKVDTKSQRQVQMTAGVSGIFGDGGSYDASATYSYHGFGYYKNDDYAFTSGGHGFGASARARFIVSRYWDLVPQISYRGTVFDMLEDATIPAFGGASNAEVEAFKDGNGNAGPERLHYRSHHTLDLGVAGALRASSRANFWIATGVLFDSVYTYLDANNFAPNKTIDDTTRRTSLPYVRFGAEGKALEWLTLRAGVEKYSWSLSNTHFENDKEAKQQSETSTSGAAAAAAIPDFGTYVGASLFLSGFTLDLLLDQNFFVRGPSFVSGAAGNIAGRATVSYKF